MELIFRLKNVSYALDGRGPPDVWVSVHIDEIELLRADPTATLFDYLLDVANEMWEAAFDGYARYELIVSQAEIDGLPEEYEFELGAA